MSLTAPVSWGELIDKITILEIKLSEIRDPAAKANVEREHAVLCAERDNHAPLPEGLDGLAGQLLRVNRKLWKIEDDIRECERQQDFGDAFIALARAVYRTNDQRAALKKQVNTLMKSDLVEEKSYRPY